MLRITGTYWSSLGTSWKITMSWSRKIFKILGKKFKVSANILILMSRNSFKMNELDSLSKMPRKVAITYMLLWDCILNFCSQAPPEIRSIYARWITENKFDEVSLILNTKVKFLMNFLLRYIWWPFSSWCHMRSLKILTPALNQDKPSSRSTSGNKLPVSLILIKSFIITKFLKKLFEFNEIHLNREAFHSLSPMIFWMMVHTWGAACRFFPFVFEESQMVLSSLNGDVLHFLIHSEIFK